MRSERVPRPGRRRFAPTRGRAHLEGRVLVNGARASSTRSSARGTSSRSTASASRRSRSRTCCSTSPPASSRPLVTRRGGRPSSSSCPHTPRVVPVGRLDADTTGALLLTNDGPLAHRLAHPRYGVEKVYEAEVEGVPAEDGSARSPRRRRAGRRQDRAGAARVLRAAALLRPRADTARGSKAPGEAHVRCGRTPGPASAPEPVRGARPQRPRAGGVARADRRRSRRATARAEALRPDEAHALVHRLERGRRGLACLLGPRCEQAPEAASSARSSRYRSWIGANSATTASPTSSLNCP